MAATASCCFHSGRCCFTALKQACRALKAWAYEKDYTDTLQLYSVICSLSWKWGRSCSTVIGVGTDTWTSTRMKDMPLDKVIKLSDTSSAPYSKVEYLGVLSSTVFACFSLWFDTWRLCSLERKTPCDPPQRRDGQETGCCTETTLVLALPSCCYLQLQLAVQSVKSNSSLTSQLCRNMYSPILASQMCAFTALLLIPWDLPKAGQGKWKQWSPNASMKK